MEFLSLDFNHTQNVYTCVLVQTMKSMAGVLNNLDFPLYNLSSTFKLVPSIAIVAEVSFMHECDCKSTKATIDTDSVHMHGHHASGILFNSLFMYTTISCDHL